MDNGQFAEQVKRQRYKMCLVKTPFANQKLAESYGHKSYHCPHCGLWHRDGLAPRKTART